MAAPVISLEDLIARFQLSRQLDRELREEHLGEVSRIIDNHQIVGPELGLSQQEMTAICSDMKGLELQKIEMLRIWKQKYLWRATYRKLIEAFLRCSRGDHARKVCELLTQSVPIASAGHSATSHRIHHDASSTDGAEHAVGSGGVKNMTSFPVTPPSSSKSPNPILLSGTTGPNSEPNSSTEIQQTSDISKEYLSKKKTRCGKCEACLAKPCGNCTPCKKRAEGLSYSKPCVDRECPNKTYKVIMKRKANPAKEPNVKRAKVIRSNSKGPDSAFVSSASSLQGHVGVHISTLPSDLRMDEEDSQEDSIEASEKDEDALPVNGGEVLYKTCLGEGTYGPVYSGVWHQGESSIPCAIKLPNCQPPTSLPALTRVKREAELALTLSHPNVVQHLEVVLDSNTHMPIFLMELMESNLTQYLQNTTTGLPLHTQVNLCCDIAFGLAYLHSHSIVHGNLTSNNILMKGERAKIADFVSGSSMPPDVRRDGSDPKGTDDVYSYGLLMIQIITRKCPLSMHSQVRLSPSPISSQEDANFGTLTHKAISPSGLLSVPSGHILERVVHSCLQDSMHRPTANTITKHLFSLSHHAQYQRSSSEAANNAQQEIDKLTLKLENMEKKATEVTTLHKKNVAQLKVAEEKMKGLQTTLKEKEAGLKSIEQRANVFQASWKEKVAELKKAEEKSKVLQATLEEKETQLNKTKELSRALQATLQQKEAKIKHDEQIVKVFQAALKEKEAELKRNEETLKALQATLKEKETELSIAEEQSKALQATLKEKVMELKKAEEKSKALQAALKQNETEIKSCGSENQRLKHDVEMRKQTEEENQKLMKQKAEQIKVLEAENGKLKESIQSLNTQVRVILESRAKLEQSKNEMKAKLVSFIQQL